ncbi:efflux RND transporter periplasmic adaptor subunit [Asticcacaulis sp. EMRT-3]|uniref:efflux RND transporter periplasmic adaptor subunit n=1 Tax=Asticcacaulis sp. EMRT-3 TaxID=3040349 RepID=UPI0024AEED90|nr:efflux RND transporter periplasmic adaptor subunit [Asticcacaulis sp. EMRT-3]MDI7776623.1 efflux RND transporter periplasmic adaptor subunit [Asticcacaulis sp. EMRT-3]
MKSNNLYRYGGAAAALLLVGAGGFGLARCTGDKPAVSASAVAVEETPSDDLKLSQEAITAANISVEAVNSGGLSSEIITQAQVVATPNGQAALTARAAGSISRIYKRLGDPVKAGEALALIESRDAGQIAADRTTALARARVAQANLAREKSLMDQGVSARVDYERAQADAAAAQAEVTRTQSAASAARITSDGHGVIVASPISGQVTASMASLGAFVQPETELFRVADPKLVQIEAAIGASDMTRVAAGDRAVIDMPDGRALEARVRSVTPSLNAETRAATAVLDVVGGEVQPGLSVRARLFPAVTSQSSAIVVPDEAVQSVNGRDVVFVRTKDGFKATPVTVGQRSAGRAEITSGLTSGQSIATRNAFYLKAELGKGAGEEG